MVNREWKLIRSTKDQSLNSTQPLSSTAKCSSFQYHNFNLKNFSPMKPGEANEIEVPSSAQSGAVLDHTSSYPGKDRENQPCWNLSFSRESLRDHNEENGRMSKACQDPSDKTPANAPFSPSVKVKGTESLKRAHPSSNKEYKSCSVEFLKSFQGVNARLDRDFVAVQEKTAHKDHFVVDSAGSMSKENASRSTNESHSKLSLRVDNTSHNVIENGSKNQEDRKHGSLRADDRRYELSETSVVDSLSALDVTPDDVIRVIGEKQFRKARITIVDQQRTFRAQVSELHRLMKVQKLIAESPHLLFEDGNYSEKALLQSSPAKKVPSVCAIEQPPVIAKQKDSSQKPYHTSEFADEHAAKKLPLPSAPIETNEGLLTQQSNQESHSTGAFPADIATNARKSPWCFPAPGNQWLVPVMSPSEGLVYKPYPGSCPPHSGYMSPIYTNCPPPSLTTGVADFLNATYGVPASHQQGIGILPGTTPFGQTCFPLCGMPIMSQSILGPAVEQVSSFAGPQSKNDSQVSVGDINITFPRQNSCNISSQMSHAISCYVGKVQTSKESEIQIHGSRASSPPQSPKGQALPLFPTEPTA